MIHCAVIGATGYVGVELVKLIHQHPIIQLTHVVASNNNTAIASPFSHEAPHLKGLVELQLQSLDDFMKATASNQKLVDVIFIATPPSICAEIAPILAQSEAQVFDLSGAFRLQNLDQRKQFYASQYAGVKVSSQNLGSPLPKSHYCLPEINALPKNFKHNIIALPGCYPTASILALHPLIQLLEQKHIHCSTPVIHGVSGASGAGKSASTQLLFCEMSLKPYHVHQHRHQPEIEQELNAAVHFTPHIAPFSRGLLVSISIELDQSIDLFELIESYQKAYQEQPFVRMVNEPPSINQVANTPFCDIHLALDPTQKQLKIFAAIDNLLKGAASQAIQQCNLLNGLEQTLGLLSPALNTSSNAVILKETSSQSEPVELEEVGS